MRWLLALFTIALVPFHAAAQTLDLAIVNAHIYTGDPAHPVVSSLGIAGGKIVSAGDAAAKGRTTIDAHGATIIPGLIDSHTHMQGLGDSLENLDLRGVTSEARAVEIVRDAVKDHKPGEWIRGRAWDQNLFDDKQFPTKEALSKAAPDNPVALTRVDGHALWVNQKALDLADVNGSTPDPPGGKILRTANGQPAGVLVDRAQGLVSAKIPKPTAEQVERRLARAAKECARLGMTSVHDAGVTPADLDAYRVLIGSHHCRSASTQ